MAVAVIPSLRIALRLCMHRSAESGYLQPAPHGDRSCGILCGARAAGGQYRLGT